MKDEFLQLKEYLTKEYMKMSEEKDDIISKKQLKVDFPLSTGQATCLATSAVA